jgi:hypothetical protein
MQLGKYEHSNIEIQRNLLNTNTELEISKNECNIFYTVAYI